MLGSDLIKTDEGREQLMELLREMDALRAADPGKFHAAAMERLSTLVPTKAQIAEFTRRTHEENSRVALAAVMAQIRQS